MPAANIPGFRIRTTRTPAVLLVAALHLLVLGLFWRNHGVAPEEPEGFVSLLFFDSPTLPARNAAATPATRIPPVTGRQPPSATLPVILPMPASASPAQPTTPEPAAPDAPHSRIDWADEAQQAAATEFEREQQDALRSDAFANRIHPHALTGATPDPRAGFRWDYAATHRLEASNGMPVWHINDRCVMPLIFPLFVACAIGHIDSHDDLFKNMRAEHDARPATPLPTDVP